MADHCSLFFKNFKQCFVLGAQSIQIPFHLL